MKNRARKPRLAVFAGAVALSLSVVACSSGDDELFSMSDAMYPGETYILSYVAKDKGFFLDHGIDMNFVFPDSGAAGNQLLLAGQIDVYSTLPLGLAAKSAITDPGSVKIVGAQRNVNAFNLLVPESEKPEGDLSMDEALDYITVKTIGVTSEASGTDLVISIALKESGRSVSDVDRLGVGTTLTALGQLQAGAIDGYQEFTRAGTSVIEGELPAKVLYWFGNPEAPLSVQAQADVAMTANSEFAEKHPEKLQDWLAALDDAREWLLDPANIDEASEIGAKYLYDGEDQELVKTAIESLLEAYDEEGWGEFKFIRERYEASIAGLIDVGFLEEDDNIKYEELVAEWAQTP